MAFTLAALHTEITTDPLAIGYAGKTDQQIAALINALTGPGAASIFRNDIAYQEIINAINSADFAGLSALQIAKLQLFQGQLLDATKSNIRTIFLGIFTGLTNTINSLTALASRTGSRAEVLWGIGTVIQWSDVAASFGR